MKGLDELLRYVLAIIIGVGFSVYLIYVNRAKEPDDDGLKTAEIVGTILQSHIDKAREGCPRVFHGRPLSRSVYRESDTTDTVLVCFYMEPEPLRHDVPAPIVR